MLQPGQFAVLSVEDADKLLKVLTRLGGGDISNTYEAFCTERATEVLDGLRDLVKHQKNLDHLRYLHRQEYED